jgi:hypothetical protein
MGKEEGGCTGKAAKNSGLAVGLMPSGPGPWDGGPEGEDGGCCAPPRPGCHGESMIANGRRSRVSLGATIDLGWHCWSKWSLP